MKRTTLLRAALCAAPVLLAGQAATGQVMYPLDGLDPSGFNTNNPSSWFRGYEFNVNADNVEVVEIGLNTPASGESVVLELWDSNTQSLVAEITGVTTHGNSWRYHSLSSPVALDNGGTYVVGIRALTQGTNYYFANGLSSDWYPTGDIEYTTMRFHNGGSQQYPTSTLDGYHYGVVDIGYVIPAPAGLALLGVGGLVAARRRRA
jgi:hypothetical protein